MTYKELSEAIKEWPEEWQKLDVTIYDFVSDEFVKATTDLIDTDGVFDLETIPCVVKDDDE